MSATTNPICCTICQVRGAAYDCAGCKQTFCLNHLTEHHREFERELNNIQDRRNNFLQLLNEQDQNPGTNSFVQQINRWERESIEKVQRTANEARELVIKHLHEHINETKTKLVELTEQIKPIQDANNYNEIHLKDFDKKLKELQGNFNRFSNISIQQQSNSFIKKLSVEVYNRKSFFFCFIAFEIFLMVYVYIGRWVQEGTTIIGRNQCGQPWSIAMDNEENLYLSDCKNHCIMKWTKNTATSEIIIGQNGKGNGLDQLNEPKGIVVDKQHNYLYIADSGNRRVMKWSLTDSTGEVVIPNINCWGLALDDTGCVYTSDIDKHEVRRWKIGENLGVLVAGSGEQGDRLNQLNNPYFIFVDHHHSVYVSDYGNHRVIKWPKGAKQGTIVASDKKDAQSDLERLSYPLGIVVDRLGTLYIADSNNHRIVKSRGEYNMSNIPIVDVGGLETNQLNTPYNIIFDCQHNLYVVDYANQRIQKFNIF